MKEGRFQPGQEGTAHRPRGSGKGEDLCVPRTEDRRIIWQELFVAPKEAPKQQAPGEASSSEPPWRATVQRVEVKEVAADFLDQSRLDPVRRQPGQGSDQPLHFFGDIPPYDAGRRGRPLGRPLRHHAQAGKPNRTHAPGRHGRCWSLVSQLPG
ncbi:MAG: hypothetical protein MZU91_00115 [Desulfosudis oleivorans]|nr:hypothetical protein [Desulfosudis oleivorans]